MRPLEVVVAHSVTDAPPRAFGPRTDHAVTPAALRDFLEERRRDGWARPRFDEALERRDPPQPALLLSFDDGYADFASEALPVLEALEMPCLLFVVSDLAAGGELPFEVRLAALVDERPELQLPGEAPRPLPDLMARRRVYGELYLSLRDRPDAERRAALAALFAVNGGAPPAGPSEYLDWDALRALDAHPLVTLGAHGRSHTLLTTLPLERARAEITECKRQLEAGLGHPVDCFAYPYGGNGFRLRRAVRRAGFRYAFTTRAARVEGRLRRYAIPRIDIRRAAGD